MVVKHGVPTTTVSADSPPVDSRAAYAAAIGEDERPLNESDPKMLARHVKGQTVLDQVNIIDLRCQPPAAIHGRPHLGREI